MSALSALEQALENRWETVWARMLGREREPVELVEALRRECDSNAVVSPGGRVMVPNAYDVELADPVHEELNRRGGGVGQALTDSLARHAARHGYAWAGPLTVHVGRAKDLPDGRRYRVASSVMRHVSAEGFQRAGR
ncbi:DUF3662 domain-containing protein [Streptomyces sp. 15-116A]|uniref:DUF3662 domain-containing protein n=1 Tax=Streptomyces sp. 15-116A TaxID=2259035 RepID=UPI0021B39BB7|nr:DUF3662 domain-containing protein [Streptomyces sp. 15-116A]MCT7355917.1 DUF3662 domain-containing protein [Streptomyces sp. 15-116A]